jgi:hypothetical protein
MVNKYFVEKRSGLMDIKNLEPGFYILECIEEIGYDECFFVGRKDINTVCR